MNFKQKKLLNVIKNIKMTVCENYN